MKFVKPIKFHELKNIQQTGEIIMNDTQVPNVGMSESPSAVVFPNGTISVFHQGEGKNGQLWYSFYGGSNWSSETQVPNVGMSGSPSAVVLPNGGISVFHQGESENGQLWYVYYPPASSPSPNGFASIVSSGTYDALFPKRNALYTYDSLVAATQKYPRFCNDGSLEQCKREAAAFLANISHETGQLVYVDEQNPPSSYCDASNTTYPCAAGKNYHGRGPLQLSWNYNYGTCGNAIGKDLLNQPELVSTDSDISFTTALWFWMTPQAPKSSCHDAIRTSGFGMTINIINGGIECHSMGQGQQTPEAQDRIQLYQQYAGMLGVSPGDNLYC
jgi:predicted chitinase